MIELSPYYFCSVSKDESFTVSYYPINQKWHLQLISKKKKIDYWLDQNQAKEIRDLLSESLQELEDKTDE